MDRKAFRQLLRKYLDHSCTEEEKRLVDQWYELLGNGYATPSPEELDEIETRLWDKVQSAAIHAGSRPGRSKIIRWRYAVAACCVGLLGLGGFWFYNAKQSAAASSLVVTKADQGHFVETNSSDEPKTIALEDGSSVVIYPGAKLAFPKQFDKTRREVYLEGEAFFDVSKNSSRPFFVYSNQIVTQVLGTSFGIRNKQGQVEVAVKTGKVAVYENKEQIPLNEVQQKSNGVIITPNQKVTYYQDERHFITSVVERPVPVVKETGQKADSTDFNYSETSLQKVLRDLEEAYELEIVVENDKIKNCLFTGDLTGENLFNKLEGICLTFGANYEVKGTRILLKGGRNCTLN
jgi:transmembrane sensor